MREPKDKLIIALDTGSRSHALTLVDKLRHSVRIFKVGLQLFTAQGPNIVRDIMSKGSEVMLDLKFHDTPDTTAKAVSEIPHGVTMFTMHASAGLKTMKAAVDHRGMAMVFAVTVLTTLDDKDPEMENRPVSIYGQVSEKAVRHFAINACEAGCDGVICSPQELAIIKKVPRLEDLKTATPGIRKIGNPLHDQRRTATAGRAIHLGADYVIVGRPVTEAANPLTAVEELLLDIARVTP